MTNLSYKYTTIYALLQRFKFAASFAFRPKTAYNKQIISIEINSHKIER